MKTPRVAVLGAGIMGTATALFLARRNVHVNIFDQNNEAVSAASRWNEGKIHLGFLYSANQTLATARQVLAGGLCFKPLIEELTGTSISAVITPYDDFYLCHQKSVVSDLRMEQYFKEVADLIKHHPDASRYCVNVSDCNVSRLTTQQLSELTDSDEIVSGFCVPERSVATPIIADRLVEALRSEKRIETVLNTKVYGVIPTASRGDNNSWRIKTSAGVFGDYDFVVNALWQGRLEIDNELGIKLPDRWSHRYRQSLFIRTSVAVQHPNVVIATGPFGDIKNYNGRDFYLSWYPTGLLAESHDILPEDPSLKDINESKLKKTILDSLQSLLPGIATIRNNLKYVELAGGWVYAAADGSLGDPLATLHSREDFGIQSMGSYYSIDTGKYSVAPWLAWQLANRIKPI